MAADIALSQKRDISGFAYICNEAERHTNSVTIEHDFDKCDIRHDVYTDVDYCVKTIK